MTLSSQKAIYVAEVGDNSVKLVIVVGHSKKLPILAMPNRKQTISVRSSGFVARSLLSLPLWRHKSTIVHCDVNRSTWWCQRCLSRLVPRSQRHGLGAWIFFNKSYFNKQLYDFFQNYGWSELSTRRRRPWRAQHRIPCLWGSGNCGV